MKITLIGGSGFVGTRLIEQLQKNFELSNIDKQASQFYNNISVIGNVLDINSMVPHLQGTDVVILLAAEHRDDVQPTQKYYDVNVEGTRNVLQAMEQAGVKHIIFTSSVAIYGLNKANPNEQHPADPFNHYGKSKWQAEEVLRTWYAENKKERNLNIIRPTVIFGERNRGNVYNLLKQIASGRFLKIGSCNNKKSMAYIGNIVAFIEFLITQKQEGSNVFNYIDKPDLSMNELVAVVGKSLHKNIPAINIPYALGYFGGICFDILAKIMGKKLPISSVRVKKFCATTQFDASAAHSSGFQAPFSLEQGLSKTLTFEFLEQGSSDGILFESE
ncbi:MAG: NAD-dependent epimerase/dehydratase family protein [Bacteroidales bacterium]